MDPDVLRGGRRSRTGSQSGSIGGNSIRRRDWRGSISSDEDGPPRMDPQLFAALLAQATQQQFAGDLRNYRTDCEDSVNCAPRSPRSPQIRQSSPFPVENTNRRLHYATSQDRLRQNGEVIYASANPKKLPSNSSLSRSGWNGAGGRRSRALTPSSSVSSGLEGIQVSLQPSRPVEPFLLDQDARLVSLRINHDTGDETPPEPAPPEVPPRGPSLRRTGVQVQQQGTMEAANNFYNQDYIVNSSPRTESRAARSPVSLSNTSSSQHR